MRTHLHGMPKTLKSTKTESSSQWLREKGWEMTANGPALIFQWAGESKINVKFDNGDGCASLNTCKTTKYPL